MSSGRVKKDRKDIECWHCLEKGHFRDDCPIKKELIQWSKERKQVKNDEEDKANKAEDVSRDEEKAFMAKHSLYDIRNPSDEWILDSRTMGHMCFNREAFQSLKKLPKARMVILGDDTEVGAYGIGTVYLTEFMVLEDVLYVPDFTINLVSVSKLARTGHMVTFEKNECMIVKDG